MRTLKELLVTHADNPAVRVRARDSEMPLDELTRQIGPAAKGKALKVLATQVAAEVQSSRVAANLADSLKELDGFAAEQREEKVQIFMKIVEDEYANSVKHSRRTK